MTNPANIYPNLPSVQALVEAKAGPAAQAAADARALAEQADTKADSASNLANALQFTDLLDLSAAENLTRGQTVIVQDGVRGGTFVIGSIGTHDNTITYALSGGLFAHRVWDGSIIYARWAGVTATTSAAGNSIGMQQALDTANARGAKVVELGAGTYDWAAACKTYERIHVRGQGQLSTILRAQVDTRFFYLDPKVSGQSGHFGVAFSDLQLRKEVFPSAQWELDLPDCIRATLSRVMTDSYQSSSNRASVSGFRFQATPGVVSFMATLVDCWCNGGSAWIEQSDSRVQGGYYWGHNREFAIRIRNTAAVSITNADVVPSPVHGGIWGDQSFGITVTSDVRGDGSYDGVATGWAVNLEGGHSHQVAGDFYQSARGSIRFSGVEYSTIQASPHRQGNRLHDANYSGGTIDGDEFVYPDILLESSSNNTVYLGSHYIPSARTGGVAPAVRESGSSGNNSIIGGQIGGSYSVPEVVLRPGGGSTITGTRGIGGRNLGMASGTAVFAADGPQFMVVRHGLYHVPQRSNVTLTPQGNPGGLGYWVDNVDSDNLVIYLSAVPTAEVRLAWRVTLD